MSKEFKNIDDLFHSAFADEATDVPAFVKRNIDAKLGFKRKRRGGFWFISLFIVLLLSATTIWFLPEPEKAPEVQNAIQTETHVNKNQLVGDHPINQKENQTDNGTAGFFTDSTKTNSDTNPKSDDPAVVSEITNKSQKSDSKKNKSAEDSETPDQVSDEKKKTGSDKISDKKSSSDYLQKSPDNTTTTTTFQENDEKRIKPLIVKMFERQENKRNNSFTHQSLRLSPPALSVYTTPDDIAALPLERQEQYNPWMISATGGINFAQSKYTSALSEEQLLYQNSNTDKPGYEANLDLKYRLKNSITFGSGIAISQLSERYSYFKQDLNIDTTGSWNYQYIYEYDSLTDSTYLIGIDSTYTEVYDSTTVTLYNSEGINKATYLHIPFSIGTQIIRNKFRFDLYLTGRFNLLVKGSGAYIQNDSLINFSKTNQIYKPWYFDLMVGAAVHYRLFDKLYITGTFRYRPRIGNVYEGLSFNRTLQSYHVGAGFSWKF